MEIFVNKPNIQAK